MSSHHHLVLSPRTCSCSWEVKNAILKYKTESNDFQIFFDLYLIGYNTKPIYTTSQKFGHTFSFNVFFFIFMTIYIVYSHWRHQNYEWTHMELCSRQKKYKITLNVSNFRFLKVAILCFVDSPADPWPSLSELHDLVTWNVFHFTDVSGFICGISCLLNGVETISCVVQKSGWYTADSPIWQLLEIILWQEPIS